MRVVMKSRSIKHILSSQDGVAILMVMTTVAILAFLLAEFTFDTEINKLKVYNIQDREQARLNAESGLKFALAKLRIYKEGFNLLQKNEAAKSAFPQGKLKGIITQPFMFPIPVTKDANIIQKNAIDEFTKNTLIRGSLMVEISQVSGFLNPNGLRMSAQSPQPGQENPDKAENENSPNVIIEKQFVETLTQAWQQKKDADEEFNALYANLNVTNLVRELKYFVNDQWSNSDPDNGEVENLYSSKGITPKAAPMSSLSEMYLLQGWDDAIIDLIKDRLSVHEVSIIPLNQITKEQLRLIFPAITDDQLAEFFRYRDGSQGKKNEEASDPHPFDSEDDFKNLIVNQLNVVAEPQYTERMKDLDKAGYRLGIAGKLFKVVSKGEYGRSKFTLVAYVDLPIKPSANKGKPSPNPTPTPAPTGEGDEGKPGETPPPSAQNPDQGKKQPLELLEPRIVEIRTN